MKVQSLNNRVWYYNPIKGIYMLFINTALFLFGDAEILRVLIYPWMEKANYLERSFWALCFQIRNTESRCYSDCELSRPKKVDKNA